MNELIDVILAAVEKMKGRIDALSDIAQAKKGDRGERGERGEKGDKGDAGEKGENGERGLKGDKGDKGEKGDRGIRGEKGEKGLDGLDGKDGKNGINGLNGKNGKDGKDGKDGIDGISIKGDKGDMPSHEWKGTQIRFELPDGKWGKFVDLIGKDGAMRFLGGASGLQTITSNNNSLTITQDGQNVDISVANSGGVQSITSPDGSIEVVDDNGAITLQVSEASPASTLLAQVRNETGATLSKGTVVYVSGAAGNKALVSKALATSDATSAQTLGVVTNDIPHNQNGYATVFGMLTDLDTSSYTEGAQLYLSSTIAGGYTSTKQSAPAHLVYVGVVTRVHQNQGTINVRVQNGYELDELHDVSIASKQNNQALIYEAATGLFKNKTIQYSMISGTPSVPTAVSQLTNDSGFITGYTETDPVFVAHAAYGITTTKIGNWDTAYGWGNHASAGYLTSSAIGVSVQAYDADLTSWAAIAPNSKQDTLTSGSNIKTINGASILGSGDIVAGDVTLTGTQTLTNKTITEMVSVIAINTNAVASKNYVITAALTLTLPTSPSVGDWIRFNNVSGLTTPIIARNGSNIMGLAENLTLNSGYANGMLIYADATRGWVLN